MKIVCASSLTLGREIFSAMGDVVLVPEKDITAAVVKDAGLLPSCVLCETIRDAKGQWHGLEEYIRSHNETDYTVSLCPACTGKVLADAPPQPGALNPVARLAGGSTHPLSPDGNLE